MIEGDYFGHGWTPNPVYRSAVFVDHEWSIVDQTPALPRQSG